jgi:hypothetical protein
LLSYFPVACAVALGSETSSPPAQFAPWISGQGIDAAAGRKPGGDSRERPGSDHRFSPDNVHRLD